ncbi:multidrug effflux MFS transporter [Demequina sp. SO4-18]|uniref:multidrug effflux MFS transporter n=1 Tax=Demequina sp. SO4-18 TaxID=3401026 RepID=UPI003B59935C
MTLRTEPAATSVPTPSFGDTLTRRERVAYILILGALVALGPFTIDLYLPAFPEVARDLAASDAAIQLTLTATTIGFGVGQLVVGPLSDAFGRKLPLMLATVVHILASIFVVFAPTVEWVLVGRVLQGIGAAGPAVVAMAIVRDLFNGQRLIRMLSRMALVTGLAPVLAPVIGSQLLRVVDWREIFVVLALYGVLIASIAGLKLRETRPASQRGGPGLAAMRARYRRLLTDRAFVGVAVVGAMTFTTLFAYLSGSSFVLQDQFGLSAQQYGVVFGLNSIGVVAGTQLAARLMRVVAPRAVATAGIIVMTGGALALLLFAALDLGLLGVIIPLFFVVSPLGFIMPSVQVMALEKHGSEAGTAASLIGAMNFGVAGLLSPIVGVLGASATSMAIVMLGALAVAHVSLWLVVRPRTSGEVVR